ncbi:MAG: hypothetical protein PUP93_34155 [Rhizonema sp. NSF051]|nr:hypothetical protein [Rhizonema sp. NSF051]
MFNNCLKMLACSLNEREDFVVSDLPCLLPRVDAKGERALLLSVFATVFIPTVQILQFIHGRDNLNLPATVAFCDEQQQCLLNIAPTSEGQTQLQKNPYPPPQPRLDLLLAVLYLRLCQTTLSQL